MSLMKRKALPSIRCCCEVGSLPSFRAAYTGRPDTACKEVLGRGPQDFVRSAAEESHSTVDAQAPLVVHPPTVK